MLPTIHASIKSYSRSKILGGQGSHPASTTFALDFGFKVIVVTVGLAAANPSDCSSTRDISGLFFGGFHTDENRDDFTLGDPN